MQTTIWPKISLKPAFTMIELIIVIVIVGILSSVAIPKFIGSNIKNSSIALKAQLVELNTEFKKELLNSIMQGNVALDTPRFFDSDEVSNNKSARGWINEQKGLKPTPHRFYRCLTSSIGTNKHVLDNTGFKDVNCTNSPIAPSYSVYKYYYRFNNSCLVTFVFARELAILAPYSISPDCKDKQLLAGILGMFNEQPKDEDNFAS